MKRIGKFGINLNDDDSISKELREKTNDIFMVKSEILSFGGGAYGENDIKYIGISPEFDEVGEFAAIPLYHPSVQYENGEEIVRWEKSDINQYDYNFVLNELKEM